MSVDNQPQPSKWASLNPLNWLKSTAQKTLGGDYFWWPKRLLLDEADIENPYAQNAWVHAAAKAKARVMASVQPVVKIGNHRDRKGQVAPSNHPLQRMLDKPNPFQTTTQFFEATSIFMDIEGEAFWVAWSEGGKPMRKGEIPREVIAINPRYLVAERDPRTGLVLGWKYTGDRGTMVFTADQVGHPYEVNPTDYLRGLSPLQPAVLGIQFDFKAQAYNKALLNNGGDPGGILYSDSALTHDEASALRSQWEDRHRGPLKNSRIAILSGGLKYERAPFSTRDMEFLQARKWSKDEIIAVLGVTRFEVGASDDYNRASAESAKAWLWQNTVLPRLRNLEDVFWHWICEPLGRGTGQDIWIEFDVSEVEALQLAMSEKFAQGIQLKSIGYDPNAINQRLELGMGAVAPPPMPPMAPPPAPPPPPRPSVGDMMKIAEGIKGGILTPQAGAMMLRASYPVVTEDEAKSMIGALGIPQKPETGDVQLTTADAPVGSSKSVDGDSEAEVTVREASSITAEDIEDMYVDRVRAMYGAMRRELMKRVDQLDLADKGEWEGVEKDDEAGNAKMLALIALLLPAREWWTATAEAYTAPGTQAASKKSLALVSKSFGGFDLVDVNDPKWIAMSEARTKSLIEVGAATYDHFEQVIRFTVNKSGLESLKSEMESRFAKLITSHAETVAYTEAAILVEGIRYAAAKEEGFTHLKWVARVDNTTRPTHKAVHEEVVKIGQTFSNGLTHPCAKDGPADEVINCRCTVIPIQKRFRRSSRG